MKNVIDIYINSWKNFGNFDGVMSRSDFWKFYFFNSLLVMFVSISLDINDIMYNRLAKYLLLFASVVVSLCNMVKRLRDANINPVNILWNFVPLFGNIYLLYILTKKSSHNI